MARPAVLTQEQVADELQVSIRTVTRRIKDGSIPARKFGAFWRIPASFVEELRNGSATLSPQQPQIYPSSPVSHAEKIPAPARNAFKM